MADQSELETINRDLAALSQRLGRLIGSSGSADATVSGYTLRTGAEPPGVDYESVYKYQIDRFINDDAYRTRLGYAVRRIKEAFGGTVEAAKLPALFAAVKEYQELVGNYSADEDVLTVHFGKLDWRKSDDSLKAEYVRRLDEGRNWFQ